MKRPRGEKEERALQAMVDADAYEEHRGVHHAEVSEEEAEHDLASDVAAARRKAAAATMREQWVAADEIPRQATPPQEETKKPETPKE